MENNPSLQDFINEQSLDVDNIAFPSFEKIGEDVEELISKDIEKAISADVVKNIDIKEAPDIETPSYLIDIRGSAVSQATLMALKGMLKGGDTAVYIQSSDTSILKIGNGDGYELYMILNDWIQLAFNSSCKVYKNSGDGFTETSSMDATFIKLNL